MESVNVNKDAVIAKWKNGDATVKSELEEIFGKEFFKGNSVSRINGYLDACDDQGLAPMKRADFDIFPEGYRDRTFALHQLDVIGTSIQGGHVPDYSKDTKKWFPVFEWDGAGFRFTYSYYNFSSTYAYLGVRLGFETEEKADHFGKTFIELHNIVLTK